MKIDIDDLVEMIDLEIEWTENNRDDAIPKDYIDGFIDGMTHSRYFIGRLERIEFEELYQQQYGKEYEKGTTRG